MFKLSPEAKVGLLVLVGATVLLYMTFAVGKYQFGEKKGYPLYASFDSVAGLDTKSSVRMAGVKIGVVDEVALEDNRAKVTMRIDPGVQIPVDAEAMIKTMGLLGEKYVEFVPKKTVAPPAGPEGKMHYKSGDRVQATVSPSDVDKLINQLSAISGDIKKVTESLSRVFGTEQGARSMEDILSDLRQTTANIREFSRSLNIDGSELVARMNDLVASLNGVVDENRDNLKVTMENVREASKNAEMALAAVENTANKIDRGEGTIGKLVNDERLYDNIDSAASGISDYVGRIERLKTTVGFRSEYLFPDAKSYATLELKPRSDTYYILELSSDPFGNYTRTTQTNTPPGGEIVTETYQDKFKFSIEFAKRWGNLALRLGLIESSGGVGADYYAIDDRIRFSFDAWNFSSNEPDNEHPHVKAAAAYNISKTLFVNAGIDNALNSRRSAAFAGIGLRFDDEDLKYLLGSVPIPK